MSVHRMMGYAFGWSDPRAVFSSKPAPPTHKRRVINEEGEMGIFENDYIHGIEDDNQQAV